MAAQQKWFISLFFLMVAFTGFAQQTPVRDSVFAPREDSLIKLRRAMLHADEQFVRFNLNEKLIDYWMETLKTEGSENYSFPRIDSMYIVRSPDRKLRIITWHILNDDLTYDFFGIAQAYSERRDNYIVYELQDKTERLPHPEYEMLRNGDWYGAIYFDIIQVKKNSNFIQKVFDNGRTYYTLLGWNGKDFKTDIKLIDVAYLQSNGDIVMGYPLFRTKDHRLRRIIFEYADRIPMSMNYDQQYVIKDDEKKKSGRAVVRRKPPNPYKERPTNDDFKAQKREKSKNDRDKEPELEPKKMIIFERLIPIRPELEGIPSQRVPHPEDYAAFIFENGRWTYYENVDALNKPSKNDDYQRTYNAPDLFKRE